MQTDSLSPMQRNAEFNRVQTAFVARAISSSEAAKRSGKYVAATVVSSKIARRLAMVRGTGE